MQYAGSVVGSVAPSTALPAPSPHLTWDAFEEPREFEVIGYLPIHVRESWGKRAAHSDEDDGSDSERSFHSFWNRSTLPPDQLALCKESDRINRQIDKSKKVPGPWSYEETVARLLALSGASVDYEYEDTVMCIHGAIDGERFILTDRKEYRIHIRAHTRTNLSRLNAALLAACARVEPKGWIAACINDIDNNWGDRCWPPHHGPPWPRPLLDEEGLLPSEVSENENENEDDDDYEDEEQEQRVEAYHAAKAALAAALKEEGWTAHTAPNGVTFYYNKEKGLSTFEKPDSLLVLGAKRKK